MTKQLTQKVHTGNTRGRHGGLNLREAIFCLEYIATNGNGKQSALAAGYGGDPTVRAAQLLARPRVMEVIDKLRTEKLSEIDARAEKVLRELVRVAFFSVKRLFGLDGSPIPLAELDADTAAVITGVEFKDGVVSKFRFASKVQALELLGDYLHLWPRSGVNVTVGGQEIPTSPEDLDRAILTSLSGAIRRDPKLLAEIKQLVAEAEPDCVSGDLVVN